MNEPVIISEDDFSVAWANALCALKNNSWDMWNLVVTIKQPDSENNNAIKKLTDFAKSKGLIIPEQVLHTIFPQRIYKKVNKGDRERFYRWYNYFYKSTRKMPHSNWGTYFERMINYRTIDGCDYDQLGSIIDHINERKHNHGASNIIFVPQIGKDSNRTMGAPCLNYVAVQIESNSEKRIISLLAVYRNHDFRERTFGNYWGLCKLLKYICNETDSLMGCITCISSHAYVGSDKSELYNIATKILDNDYE